MQNLTPEGLRMVADAAKRHGVGLDAAVALLGALSAGNGRQAQFNHPELGGMGQWSEGGMIMIGDMFNSGLKSRVDALCAELAGLLRSQPPGQAQTQSQGDVGLFAQGSAREWWPAGLGTPASAGAQNDLRYAFFPETRRLAIEQDGRLSVYDTGEHRLSGFSQQQGGDRSLTFMSQFGLVRLADLRRVDGSGEPGRDQAPPEFAAPSRQTVAPLRPVSSPAAEDAPPKADDILKTIERLAELHRKDILTDEEFSAKKTELLGRL